MKPKKRSRLRMAAGVMYFRTRRYLTWTFGRQRFAKERSSKPFPHVLFHHATPLLRKLANVDMWMQINKITNLHLAVQQLNGIVILPGETFSYWKLIGRPTRRKGYVEGMLLSHGQVTPGVGGGLCQLSNLIYWMTLHTPLLVTERYRHSYDVFPDSNRKLPFGSGATCFYNYLDLQIVNPTSQPVQLTVYLTETELIGEWRSVVPKTRNYEVYEKAHWITHEWWGGYMRHNTLHRRISDLQNNLIDDEFVTENHAIMMYEPMLPKWEAADVDSKK